MSHPTPDVSARRKLLSNPTAFAVTSTTNASAALAVGCTYYVTATCDCFIKQGASTVVAIYTNATTCSNPLWARERVEIFVESTADAYVAAITSSAGISGTVYISKAEG